MKFNVVKTQEQFIEEVNSLPRRVHMELNIKGRLFSLCKYTDGITLWWGDNYGIDCEDVYDVVDKIEMLTYMLSTDNEIDCYFTKKAQKIMKGK